MELSTFLWIGGAVVAVAAYCIVTRKTSDGGGKTQEHVESTKSGNNQPKKSEEPPVKITDNPPKRPIKVNIIKAKKAFLNNLESLAPLLSTLPKDFNVSDWTAAIITINDADLIGLWEKYAPMPNKWLQLLASWQIKSDTCKSFTCATDDNLAAYSLPDGSKLTLDVKYKVVQPCWVHTLEDEQGRVKKEVLSKGIVVPFEN